MSNPLPKGAHAFTMDSFPGLEYAPRVVETFRERFGHLEASHPPFDFAPVVSILGERGSGKTSALLTLIATLREENKSDLVLAHPLDPHRFLDGDRLINWLLAAIKPHVDELSQGCDGSENHTLCNTRCVHREAMPMVRQGACSVGDIGQCYERLAERIQQSFQSPIKPGTSSIDDKFRQVHLEKALDFPDHMNRFIRCLTDAHAAKKTKKKNSQDCPKPPLLIVSIDDSDLVPEYMEDILRFLRIIAQSVRRLVLIITMDENLATKSRMDHYIRQMFPGLLEVGRVDNTAIDTHDIIHSTTEMAEQFMAKFMPYEARFSLTPFGPVERLGFTPHSAKDTAREDAPEKNTAKKKPDLPCSANSLCDLLRADRHLGLRQLFEPIKLIRARGDEEDSFPYAEILPSNPRLLEEIYFVLLRHLEHLVPEEDEPTPQSSPADMAARKGTLRKLADLIFVLPYAGRYGNIAKAISVSRTTATEDLVHVSPEGIEPRLTFRFSYSRKELSSESGLQVYSYGGFRPELILRDNAGRSQIAPSPLAYGYLFLQEFYGSGQAQSRDDPAFPFRLERPLPEASFHVIPPLELRKECTEEDRFLDQICPLILCAGDRQFFCPLPPWPSPFDWLKFDIFWDAALKAFSARLEKEPVPQKERVIRLLKLWIYVSIQVFNSVSKDKPDLDVMRLDIVDEMNMTLMTQKIMETYRQSLVDIWSGTSPPMDIQEKSRRNAFICWVERGLYSLASLDMGEEANDLLAGAGIGKEQLEKSVIQTAMIDIIDKPRGGTKGATWVAENFEKFKASIPTSEMACGSVILENIQQFGNTAGLELTGGLGMAGDKNTESNT